MKVLNAERVVGGPGHAAKVPREMWIPLGSGLKEVSSVGAPVLTLRGRLN